LRPSDPADQRRETPVVSNIFGKIATSDGTHPSALRETIVDVDKDIKVSVKGYPVCNEGQLTARNTNAALKVCGNTVLGKGIAHAEIKFPNNRRSRSPVRSPRWPRGRPSSRTKPAN